MKTFIYDSIILISMSRKSESEIEEEMLKLMVDAHTVDDTAYTKGIDLCIFFYYWTELTGGPFRDELWDLFWREETWNGIENKNPPLSVDDKGSSNQEMICEVWNKLPFENLFGGHNNARKEPKSWDEFWKDYSRVRWSKGIVEMTPDGTTIKIK